MFVDGLIVWIITQDEFFCQTLLILAQFALIKRHIHHDEART